MFCFLYNNVLYSHKEDEYMKRSYFIVTKFETTDKTGDFSALPNRIFMHLMNKTFDRPMTSWK